MGKLRATEKPQLLRLGCKNIHILLNNVATHRLKEEPDQAAPGSVTVADLVITVLPTLSVSISEIRACVIGM